MTRSLNSINGHLSGKFPARSASFSKSGLLGIMLSISYLLITAPSVALAQEAFDAMPHVLIMSGHTSSVEWDSAAQKYIPTCDYKSMSGEWARRGEPCDGSPRLSYSVENLRNLRYITETQDLNELVRRIYERFPKVLIVTSPDLVMEYGNSEWAKESGEIHVRHPDVSDSDYEFFANAAREMLEVKQGTGVHTGGLALGLIVAPEQNHWAFGENPLEFPVRSRLPQFSLIFLPKNPDRTTIIHELLHHFEYLAMKEQTTSARIEELNQNQGKYIYLFKYALPNISQIVAEHGTSIAGELEIMRAEYHFETMDSIVADELEVAFFISKFGSQLNMPEVTIRQHRADFWRYADLYQEEISSIERVLYEHAVQADIAVGLLTDNAPLPKRPTFYENPLFDILPIPTFRALWAAIKAKQAAYPRDLLGDETNPRPGTMLYQFIRDIGTRAQTGQR